MGVFSPNCGVMVTALGRDGVMVTVLNGQDFRELDIPFKRHAARPAIGVGIGIDCAVRVFSAPP